MKRLLPLVAILCTLSAFAAQPLSGRIAGPTGEAMPYATVVLLREGTQAAGTTADSLGTFRLEAEPGTYTLQARHLSAATLEKQVTLTPADTDLGELRMQTGIAVGEVTIRANSVTREADRFVLTVGNSTAMTSKDGTEVLSEAPGVWIDDKGVAINGTKGVKVFVDDRELRLDGEQLTAYLRTLTAADIARVEVIPQAGSEYAADARGGVLRIVLRRQASNGIHGSLTAAVSQGSRLSDYDPSGNISIRAGRWTINAAGSGSFTTRGESHYDQTRAYTDRTSRFAGTSDLDSRTNSGSGRLGLFCDISPRHTFGAEAEYITRDGTMPSRASTRIEQQGVATSSQSRYAQHTNMRTLNAAFNYIWKIDTVGSALKLLADYTRRRSSGANRYAAHFLTGELSRDTLYRSATAAHYDIFSAEAGLDKRFAHGIKLLTGIKYTGNRLSDDALYDGKSAAGWTPAPTYNYSLGYTEHIAAAYLSLGAAVGRWNLSAGLRGEYTGTDGHGSTVHGSYFGLFPSASASVALNPMRTWMIAAQYGRNIERPGFRALNPARIQFSEYNYTVGNPSLHPTYIHRASLTLIWKYRYTLSIGGNLHRDLIREVSKTDPTDPDVTLVTPENHDVENHWFAALSAPAQLMKGWTLNVNFVGVKQDIRLTPASSLVGHWLMFATVTSGVELPAKFYFELSYNGHSRLYSGNSEVAPRHLLSATLKKRLCRDRLTVWVTVRNINGAGEEYRSVTDGLEQTMTGYSAFGSRYCKVGLTWNFRTGKEFAVRKIEGAAETERQRLKNDRQQ